MFACVFQQCQQTRAQPFGVSVNLCVCECETEFISVSVNVKLQYIRAEMNFINGRICIMEAHCNFFMARVNVVRCGAVLSFAPYTV